MFSFWYVKTSTTLTFQGISVVLQLPRIVMLRIISPSNKLLFHSTQLLGYQRRLLCFLIAVTDLALLQNIFKTRFSTVAIQYEYRLLFKKMTIKRNRFTVKQKTMKYREFHYPYNQKRYNKRMQVIAMLQKQKKVWYCSTLTFPFKNTIFCQPITSIFCISSFQILQIQLVQFYKVLCTPFLFPQKVGLNSSNHSLQPFLIHRYLYSMQNVVLIQHLHQVLFSGPNLVLVYNRMTMAQLLILHNAVDGSIL